MKHTTLPIALALTLLCASLKAQVNPVSATDPAITTDYNWHRIQKWNEMSKNQIKMYPADTSRARFSLNQASIDQNSTLGAFVFHCGGLVVDNGWLRVLGSGCPEFKRGLVDWNNGKKAMANDTAQFLMIADDVIGGFFALAVSPNIRLESAIVYYKGPHDLSWSATGMRYSDFLRFCFFGQIKEFYDAFRWKGWDKEIQSINEQQVISCYPLLWTREGKEIKANRKVMPIQRLWELYQSN